MESRPSRGRDPSLDVLKGVACLFMVLIHASIGSTHPVILGLSYLGSFAPVLFLAVTGITALGQSERYRLPGILRTYAALGFFGLAYNVVLYKQPAALIQLEILQSLAICGTIVLLLLQVFRLPISVFAVLGIVVFLLKQCSGGIPGSTGFPLGWLVPISSDPSFPILPWVSYCFLGIFAYRVKNIWNLIISSGVLVVLGCLLAAGIPMEITQKWDMSAGYFLVSCGVLFGSFFIVRRLAGLENRVVMEFQFLGRHSLLFLFLHFGYLFFKRMVLELSSLSPEVQTGLMWIATLCFTGVAIRFTNLVLLRGSFQRHFMKPEAWIVLGVGVILVPLLTPDINTIFILELIFGVYFASFYPCLSRLLKQPTVPETLSE